MEEIDEIIVEIDKILQKIRNEGNEFLQKKEKNGEIRLIIKFTLDTDDDSYIEMNDIYMGYFDKRYKRFNYYGYETIYNSDINEIENICDLIENVYNLVENIPGSILLDLDLEEYSDKIHILSKKRTLKYHYSEYLNPFT